MPCQRVNSNLNGNGFGICFLETIFRNGKLLVFFDWQFSHHWWAFVFNYVELFSEIQPVQWHQNTIGKWRLLITKFVPSEKDLSICTIQNFSAILIYAFSNSDDHSLICSRHSHFTILKNVTCQSIVIILIWNCVKVYWFVLHMVWRKKGWDELH